MCRYGHLTALFLCIAASCGPSSTAQPTAGPPAPVQAERTPPAEPVAAASAPAKAPAQSEAPADETALAPDAAPALAPIDIRTADGVVEFVRRMCERAKAGDAAWVQAHIAQPLAGNVLVNDDGKNQDDPLLGSHLEIDAASLARHGICQDPPALGSEIQGLTVDGTRVTGMVEIGRFDHRLMFVQEEAAAPRLVELSFVLPNVRMPAKARKAPKHDLYGRVKEATEGFGGMIDAVLLDELKRRPACIQQHFVRNRVSASLGIMVSKEDGKEAVVRVYASTVAPASLLGCLEKQLGRAIAKLFRGVPFHVDYHLILAVPVPADELGDDVPTIMSGE